MDDAGCGKDAAGLGVSPCDRRVGDEGEDDGLKSNERAG
jgi:hypothetical protein